MKGALAHFPVKVIQGTSDEGKGLILHVTKDLNAHHSPALFHVIYEISSAYHPYDLLTGTKQGSVNAGIQLKKKF